MDEVKETKQKINPSQVVVEYSTEIDQATDKWWRRNSDNGGKFTREDLRQEAALAAIKACERFKPEKGSLGGYIYSSASREVMKYVQENTYDLNVSRSTQEGEKIHHGWALDLDMKVGNHSGNSTREETTLGDLIPASGELPLDKMQKDEEQELLMKSLAALNPIEYNIIYRHKLQEESMKDIAAELGMTTNNLYNIERRGLEKLKNKMQELARIDIG